MADWGERRVITVSIFHAATDASRPPGLRCIDAPTGRSTSAGAVFGALVDPGAGMLYRFTDFLCTVRATLRFVGELQVRGRNLSQVVFRRVFNSDQPLARNMMRSEQLVQLQMDTDAILVLGFAG
jgi:hypothetical protein